MEELSRNDKLQLISSLTWGYTGKPEDALAVIERVKESSWGLNQDELLVCSLEQLPWQQVLSLWGVEAIKKLYTNEISERIFPMSRRKNIDLAVAVLRREPLSPVRFGAAYFNAHAQTFYANRSIGGSAKKKDEWV